MIYMAVTLSIVTAFSPNYTVYMAIRTVNGLTFPALFQIPYILGELPHLLTSVPRSCSKMLTPSSDGAGRSRVPYLRRQRHQHVLRPVFGTFGRSGLRTSALVSSGSGHVDSVPAFVRVSNDAAWWGPKLTEFFVTVITGWYPNLHDGC